jgi:EmrB/QacA subfamily drug resistance transporter
MKRTPYSNPWNALWAMMVGFFMILVDSTIVAVANPSIMTELGTGYDMVIWVTSAYLLAYAAPLLVAGRLGDRFGPKNLYLAGLAVFTAASLWCGLAGSIGMLIAARLVQGIGAAVLTPQTLSMITRIFPAERRGMAMSVWGATAGVATLVGPLAGGLLVDALGWEWIFFVNVPIGVIGLVLAVRLVPALPTHTHRFDLVGVGLSGLGMALIVFALQEGQSQGWAPWIWAVIVAGIGLMTAFVYWQSINTGEPLIPLAVFRDRDFCLSNLGVAVIGFAATAMMLPLMFYAQAVCGLSATLSALLTAPMAISGGLLAPLVGKIIDQHHPRPVVGFGFSVLAITLTWLSIEMTPETPIWRLVLPFTAMGVGMAFTWQPLGATAARNLPPGLAGAGSGVFNATRQVGAALGSAAAAAFMTARIGAELPATAGGSHRAAVSGRALQLSEFLREPFSAAMSQSMLLPAFIALFGVAAALFMMGVTASAANREPARDQTGSSNDGPIDGFDGPTEPVGVMRGHPNDFADAGYDDDDDYVEFEYPRSRAPDDPPERKADGTGVEQISFAHNGFHVDHGQRLRPIAEHSLLGTTPSGTYHGSGHARSSRRALRDDPLDSPPPIRGGAHQRFAENERPRNRHHRADPSDPVGYGRHSIRDDKD